MISEFDDTFDNDITTRTKTDLSNKPETQPETVSVFTLKYYQRFFNVDTDIVLDRIYNLSIPRSTVSNYMENKINKAPDLYGPFWIVVTLIFAVGVSGNLADFLNHLDDYKWHYNFHLLSYAATIIISYVIFIPLTLWATIHWTSKKQESSPEDVPDDMDHIARSTTSLLSLICVYGYSLAIYIPVSLLWTVQISTLQYALMIIASISSGLSLIIVLRPNLTSSKYGFALTLSVGILHFLLAAGLMLYFFHDSNISHETSVHQTKAVDSVLNKTKS